MFVLYVNPQLNHAMIHLYKSCAHSRNRLGLSGWSGPFDSEAEALVEAKRLVPSKHDTRLCYYCSRRTAAPQ